MKIDRSFELEIVDFELVEQDTVVIGCNSSGDKLSFGIKSFVANSTFDDSKCFDKVLDSLNSCEMHASVMENNSDQLKDDLLTVSISELENSFSFETKLPPVLILVEDNPLEWINDSVESEVENEVFVYFDMELEVGDDMRLASSDMHTCTVVMHANFNVYKDDNGVDKQQLH